MSKPLPSIELCPRVEEAFGLLAKKWMGLIIYSLSEGEKRFCELQKGIPDLSARLLSERFRELEAAGLVTRTVAPSTPVKVSYRLTESGRSLAKAVAGIAAWALERQPLEASLGLVD
jgi:DNA-binding HxlR family transcriptional regulator